MAKGKAMDRGERIPRLMKARLPTYFQQLKARNEDTAPLKPALLEKRKAEQIISGLKLLAGGWDAGIQQALNMPKALFFYSGVGSRFYSSSESADLGSFVRNLAMGRLIIPNADYGIVLYETSSSVYFVLFDARRRIAVREPLLSYRNMTPVSGWQKVRESVEAAASLAGSEEARKKGMYAVFDGTLRMAAPEEPALISARPPESAA